MAQAYEDGNPMHFQETITKAKAAFWAMVTAQYDYAKTGDLEPAAALAFDAAATNAVAAWVQSNAPDPLEGIARAIDRLRPNAEAHVGNSGGNVLCVYATLPDGRGLLIGAADDTWGGSIFEGAGHGEHLGEVRTTIPTESTDYDDIAAALLHGVSSAK
jgi:hypothetical protein